MKSLKRLVVLVFSLVAIALLASCGAYGHDTYKVTFFDGDNELGNVEVEWGKKIEEIPTFTKIGYTFDYWCSDRELKNKFDFSTEVTEVVNLYSKWNVNSYTVTFKLEDGTTYQTVTQNYQTTISVTEPTSENQEFVGWYKDLANESSEFNMKVPASNITVYAKFEDNLLNIKFDANAADVRGKMDEMKSVGVNTALVTSDFTRSGYDFAGWALEPNGEVVYQDGQTITSIEETKTVTLYAIWTPKAYSVIFIVDGLQYLDANSNSYTYQGDFTSAISYPTENPSKNGYAFMGWFKYQLTTDTTFQEEKVYYINSGTESSPDFEEANVITGAQIDERTYYELHKSENDRIPLEGIRLYAVFTANEYTITFNANGGSEVASLKSNYNSAIQAPTAPTRNGYTFVGWYEDEALTKRYTFTTMPLDGKTLYAKWEVVSYTLTYTLNGGEATNNANYNVETETFTLANPTKTGYTFLGWTGTGLETPTLEVKVEKGSTGNKEFAANFTINQYTINFNTNGGSKVTAIKADYNATVEAPANPTKVGYTFAGWFSDEALTKSFAFSQMPLDGATLYAKWTVNQYTVSFDTKGGLAVTNVKADFGTELTAPTTTKQGYVFAGWFEENAETAYVFATVEARNVELEARWTPATDTKYTVKHYLQNVNDDNYTLSENDNEEKQGTTEGLTNAEAKQFAGFHALTITQQTVKADGTTVVEVKYDRDLFTVTFVNKDTQAEITKVENVKYEATLGSLPQALTTKGYEFTTGTFTKDTQVKQNLTVEVEYTPVSNSVFLDGEKYNQFDYGTEVVIPNPTKTGYEFTGWLEEGIAHASTFTMPDDNVYLTSTWNTVTYTLTYKGLEGAQLTTANPESYTIETASFDLNNPTKVGYTFLGWTAKDLTDPDDTVTIAKGSTGHKEFTANWEAIVYTLTCKLNGGEATNKATYTIETETFTLANPTKTGYTFLGWTGTGLTGNTLEVKVEKGSTGHKEFTANFQVNQYKITFVTNGGSTVTEITQNYETTVTKPADPTRTGYTFAGWFADEALEHAYTFGTMPLNGATLYAKWNLVTYTITYTLNGGAATNNATYTIETETFTLSNPTKTGYKFLGWTGTGLEANTLEVKVEKGSTGHKDFTANFQVNQYTITFVTNGGSTVTEITQDYETTVTKPADPTRTGYTFAGWFADEALEHAYTFGTMPLNGKTLYAKWTPVAYALTYVLDGGTVTNNATYTIETETFTLNNPTKKGHTFTGWKLEGEETTNTTVTIEKGSHGDRKYIATWSKNKYQLKHIFEIDGEELQVLTVDLEYDSLVPERQADNRVIGDKMWIFQGWDQDITLMPDHDVVLRTVYTSYSYSITFTDGTDSHVIATVDASGSDNFFVNNYVRSLYNNYLVYESLENLARSIMNSFVIDGTLNGLSEEENAVLNALGQYAVGVATGKIAANPAYLPNFYKPLAYEVNDYLILLVYMNTPAIAQQLEPNKYLDESDNPFGAQQFLELFLNKSGDREDEYYVNYLKYKNNGYYPYGNDDSYSFDHWKVEENWTQKTVKYTAIFNHKLATPTHLEISSSSATSITIIWDEVAGAAYYKVLVKKNGVEQDPLFTQTNSQVISVGNGEEIEVRVVAVSNPESTNVDNYTNSSFENESVTIKARNVELNSEESAVFKYINIITQEVSFSQASDYYYVGTIAGEGFEPNLYVFTTTYRFGFKSLEIISPENSDDIATVSKDEANDKWMLLCKKPGEITIQYVNSQNETKKRNVVISYLPTGDIKVGESLIDYSLTTNELSSTEYLNASADSYKVGFASTQKVINSNEYSYTPELSDTTYYNGFSFKTEVEVSGNSNVSEGKVYSGTIDGSKCDLEYKFSKWNGSKYEEVSADDLYVYDKEHDSFYFLSGELGTNGKYANEGVYKVEISFKKDTSEYTNSSIPNKLKEFYQTASFEFELGQGINVYNHMQLREAVDNNNVTAINIHNTITAKLLPNQVIYVDYAKNVIKADVPNRGDKYFGELNITNAVMSETTTNSPKMWSIATGNDTVVFRDIKGTPYKYDLSGKYAIESCDWVEDYTDGKFYVINGTMLTINSNANFGSHGLRLANVYERVASSMSDPAEDLVINGNYFAIDGSKLPFVISNSHVTLSGYAAAYEIQSTNLGVLAFYSEAKNTVNNLEIIGNSMDASAYLNQNAGSVSSSIADYMSRTSGGYNGVRSSAQNYNRDQTFTEKPTSNDLVILNNVIIRNTVIGIYYDYDSNVIANYTRIKQSWANSTYSYAGDSIKYSHCLIETSGGGSTHLDDAYYLGIEDLKDNPSVYFDRGTVVNNYVSGEEYWFKAYAMEILALQMKSMINDNLVKLGYTVLDTQVDAYGRETEKMNLVFLGKDNPISDQYDKDIKSDINVEIYFGTEVPYSEQTAPYFAISNGVNDYLTSLLSPAELTPESKVMIDQNNEVFVLSNVTLPESRVVHILTRIDLSKYDPNNMMSVIGEQKFYLEFVYPLTGFSLYAMLEIYPMN